MAPGGSTLPQASIPVGKASVGGKQRGQSSWMQRGAGVRSPTATRRSATVVRRQAGQVTENDSGYRLSSEGMDMVVLLIWAVAVARPMYHPLYHDEMLTLPHRLRSRKGAK